MPEQRSWPQRFAAKPSPLTAVILVVPVFLLYHLGILLIDLRNGVDLVSTLMVQLLELSMGGYLALTVLIGFGLLGVGVWLKERGNVDPLDFAPVLIESTVLAIGMLFTVGWAIEQVFAAQTGAPPLGPMEKLIMAAGAGFHEELIFRVLLFGGAAAVLSRLPLWPRWAAYGVAAVSMALVFSAVHYIGPMGDTLRATSFFFRFLAGLYLTAVYAFRGFAVAVYTHTIYDLIVFFWAD